MSTYNINRKCLSYGFNHGRLNFERREKYNFERKEKSDFDRREKLRSYRRRSTGYNSVSSERSTGSDQSYDYESNHVTTTSREFQILQKDAVFKILDGVFENLSERWEISRMAFEKDCQKIADLEHEQKMEKPRKTANRYNPVEKKKEARKSLIPNRKSFSQAKC